MSHIFDVLKQRLDNPDGFTVGIKFPNSGELSTALYAVHDDGLEVDGWNRLLPETEESAGTHIFVPFHAILYFWVEN